MSKRIITVFGATGAQGGGLARAILDDGQFGLRAITRKPESDKARALADAGADVVAADLDDAASLQKALRGAWGAFVVTNYWESFSPEREKSQVRNFIQAAEGADLHHVIWSTLEDTRKDVPLNDDRMPTLMGEYKVPHFDAKGESDALFARAGLPTTYLRASFYWDNFIYFGSGPRRAEDGKLDLVMPMGDKELAGIAAKDIGGVAYGIFRSGNALIGKTVGAAGEHLTGKEMAAKMSAALGEEVRYQPISPADFRALGIPAADDLGNMFQYYQEFEEELAEVRSVERSRELYPKLQDFDAWLAENASLIPLG
jgi:uncharacterized protein YbjT (DUF2867 family)